MQEAKKDKGDKTERLPLPVGLLQREAVVPTETLTQLAGLAPPGLPVPPPGPARPVRPPPGLSFCPYGTSGTAKLGGPKASKVVSVGTVGHPQMCRPACTQDPCEDGGACTKCHLCSSVKEKAPAFGAQEICPSVGSMGHPFSCALACKYEHKSKKCKDGKLCVRCHLCPWSRYMPSKQTMPR